MAKQGKKHYYTRHSKKETRPLIAGADGKVYHGIPHAAESKIPAVFPAIDNDLAMENLSNDFDMTAADLQNLQ